MTWNEIIVNKCIMWLLVCVGKMIFLKKILFPQLSIPSGSLTGSH